jgi:hypothetical protein
MDTKPARAWPVAEEGEPARSDKATLESSVEGH